MSITDVANGGCLGAALDRPDVCAQDPVAIRARERERDAAARGKAVVEATRGMTAAPTIRASLDRLGKLDVAVPARTCHVLVWALAEDARPADVRISVWFETARRKDGGLTGFGDARVGMIGPSCSSLAGTERFQVVDRFTLAPVPSGGSGGVAFTLFTRSRTGADPDPGAGVAPPSGGSVGTDCQDCTFPCESDRTACQNDCLRGDSADRRSCERTCEQIARSCLRACRGCN
jgi:hypothetical protein